MSVTEEQIRETAKRAAEVLRQRGWCQGMFCANLDGTGPVCLMGAVSVAGGDGPNYGFRGQRRDLHVAIADRVERSLDLRGSVAGWNDAPGRTADEVIAVLERVAAGEGA